MLILVAALAIVAPTTVAASWASTTPPGTYSFFTATDVSHVPIDPDSRPVELGLRFTSSRGGTLTAVRFLKAAGTGGSHPVTVWTARGQKLATATSSDESRSGWQEVELPTPVWIEAGQVYVVSYHTSRYRATQRYFRDGVTSGPLATSGAAGVYTYGSGSFPTSTWQASNYWVDVVFAPAATGSPSPSASVGPTVAPSRTPTTRPTSTGSPTPRPSPTSTAGDTLGLPRVAWEGGPAYYGAHSAAGAAGWTDPSFFPIGVWYEGVLAQEHVDLDRGAGLNTYIMLTADSDLRLIQRNGMYAMVGDSRGAGAETTSWVLNDEVDMWGGPGDGTWTGRYPGQGDVCVSGRHDCGHDVLRRLSAALPSGDGRMRYSNFGKGVMFWQSDTEASRFVNDYTAVVSNDIYWYTDPAVCTSASEGPAIGVTAATCRRAANYGLTMDRMRGLDAMDGRRQPVWAFVEVGHPSVQDHAPTINADQIAGAVMNSLIHEARGVIYFNHNFGGPCISQHVLRDRCGQAVRPTVSELNRRITALAPVLNTQSYEWRFNANLDTMLKAHGGSYYIFAMPGRGGGPGVHRLALPPKLGGARAEVLFESRSVPVRSGVIEDNFAKESAYHIYKITP